MEKKNKLFKFTNNKNAENKKKTYIDKKLNPNE